MSCEQVKALLSAYLDSALSTEEQEIVAAHLHSCIECNALLSEYRHLDTLVAHLPRISPDPSLRQRIFRSPEYLELTGTFGRSERTNETAPHRRARRDHPHLVALPGGRQPSVSSTARTRPNARMRVRRRISGQYIQPVLAVACLCLALLMGGFISWNLLHQQSQSANDPTGITPPAGPQQGPIPAGTRFIFLRDGTLWSAPTDGSTDIVRLTPENVSVATSWSVRPPRPGRSAGNMLAYIDLQRGSLHIIRSDGQSDTIISTPLLKQGTQPAAIWDTDLGAALLNGMAWSGDGNTLAFVAAPTGTPELYLYSTNSGQVERVSLPTATSITHPIWSPDSARVAFTLAHGDKIDILDYNTQNHGVLTVASSIGSAVGDHVLALDWSPDTALPAVTWSVGNEGHVHSLWTQRVGVAGTPPPRLLTRGDYVEATYSHDGHGKQGLWLLTGTHQGLPGDLFSANLNGELIRLTSGKQASFAQWSPDGQRASYLDGFASGMGALHIVNLARGSDTLITMNVNGNPAPTWSSDGKRLAYCTSTHILIINVSSNKAARPLKLQGPATALSWSSSTPTQLVLALGDGQQGIYLVDTQHDTALHLDSKGTQGPILWSLIP